MIDRGCKLVTTVLAAVATISLPAVAQQVANPGFASVGRGAPLVATLPPFVPSAAMAGPPGPAQLQQIMESAARFPFVGPTQPRTSRRRSARRSTTARGRSGAADFDSAQLGTATFRTASSRWP